MKKPIIEFPNYYAGSDGFIYSNKFGKMKKLKPQLQSNGYYKVDLYCNNKRARKYIHRLIAETYLLLPCDGKEINHIDADKYNNSIDNLEAITHKENMKHAKKLGLCKGAINPTGGKPKLTIGNVIDSRKLHLIGFSINAIAKLFGVHRTTMSAVVNRKTWKYI